MMSFRSFFCYLTAFGIILASLTDEVEARRTILRGRKTLNRSYLRDNAIPAWAIVVIVGFCQIVLGGVFYIVLRKIMISNTDSYSPAPAGDDDDDDDPQDPTGNTDNTNQDNNKGQDDTNGSTTGQNTDDDKTK